MHVIYFKSLQTILNLSTDSFPLNLEWHITPNSQVLCQRQIENPCPLGLYSVSFHTYTYSWIIKVEREPQIYDHMLKIIKKLMSNFLKLYWEFIPEQLIVDDRWNCIVVKKKLNLGEGINLFIRFCSSFS